MSRKLRGATLAAILVPLLAGLAVLMVPEAASGSDGGYSSGFKWNARNGVNVMVYDATVTAGMSDAVSAALLDWNQSSVVELGLTRVPGDCRDRNGAIVICEGEDCSGYSALMTMKGKNQISKVRIILMPGCGDWAFRDAGSRLSAACHELGHALGLAHRELESLSCMAQNGSLEPDGVDYSTLVEVYGK